MGFAGNRRWFTLIRFIIAGLPRSGTTWLSVFLSTDDCLCLHDPIATLTPKELEKWDGGVCDTGLWYFEDWCKQNTEKFVIIDRNFKEVNKSLSDKGIDVLPEFFEDKFHSVTPNKKFYFEDLFTEEIAEELWTYIYPEKPFNKIRWNELKNTHIEPTEEIFSKCRKGE